jgi:hypothetical protein
MSEITVADVWIRQTLMNDGDVAAAVSTRIYPDKVPANGTFPCIVYALYVPEADTIAVGDITVMSNFLYIVKMIVQGGSYIPANAMARKVNQLLHSASGSNAYGAVLACRREQPFRQAESKKVGQIVQEFRSLGGIYRLWVQEAE